MLVALAFVASLAADPPALEPLAPESPAAPSQTTTPSAPSTTPSAPATTPDAPKAHELVDVPERGVTGTMGGVLGAASGCAAGVGVPLIGLGGAGGFLAYLYTGAAAGTIIGWTPACIAGSTAVSMIGVATCAPMVGAGAAMAGAMYGANADGRDPVPAMLGALPGVGLAVIATSLGVVAIGIGAAGSIAAAAPVAILAGIALVIGLSAPPCAACGAGIADVAFGNRPPKALVEEPLAGTAAGNVKSASMRF